MRSSCGRCAASAQDAQAARRISCRRGAAAPRAPGDGGALVWDVPVADIRRSFEAALSARESSSITSPPLACWGGYGWRLMLTAKCRPKPATQRGCTVGLFVFPQLPPGCTATAFAAAVITLRVGSKLLVNQDFFPFGHESDGVGGAAGRGFDDLFMLGLLRAWDEAVWHRAGLLEGGLLKLRLTVRNVV